MTLALKLFKILVTIATASIMICWVALGVLIDSGSLPKSAQPLTHHIIPYNNHGTTYYLTEHQGLIHTWAIPAFFGMSLLYWLVGFIVKKTHDKTVA
jgi:hypothetical protein